MPRATARHRDRDEAARAIALADTQVWHPSSLNGTVEVVVAAAADRRFPPRMSESLGVCLKHGPDHAVRSNGRHVVYPADAISVRPPGCVWSCESTGPAGFASIDITREALPDGLRAGPMTFVSSARLPELTRALAVLEHARSSLAQQEAVTELLLALDAVIGIPSLRARAPRQTVARTRELLAHTVARPPTLDELGAAVGANKFVLLRAFKDELGITPHAYVVALRVERARQLLAKGTPPVEVANRIGFSDQPHLNRTFKAVVGMTPLGYARSVRRVVGVAR